MRSITTVVVALILWLTFGCLAQAQPPLLLSQSYWMDTGGMASLDEAMNAPYHEFSGALSQGYTPSTAWVRLSVAGVTGDQPLVVTVYPPFLHTIELFDPSVPGGAQAVPQVSGRASRPGDSGFEGIIPGFSIPASAEPRELYLRIRTPTTLLVSCHVMPAKEALHKNRTLIEALTTYIGFLLLVCLWALINWAIQREGLYGLFALRQFYSLTHIVIYVGLLRYWGSDAISSTGRDFIYNFIILTIGFVLTTFELKLLASFGTSRRLRIGTGFLIIIQVITNLVLYSLGYLQDALQFNNATNVFFAVCLIGIALTTSADEETPMGRFAIWLIRIGYLVQFSMILASTLAFGRWIESNDLILYLQLAHPTVSTILMLSLLAIRARQQAWAMQQSELRHGIAQAKLEVETQRREEKERFLSMLTHELGNPLSVIRLKINPAQPGATALKQAADDMIGILERVQQSERMESNVSEIGRKSFDVAALIRELVSKVPAPKRIRCEGLQKLQVESDPQLLEVILKNLIDNAIKYSPADSPIRLRTEIASRDNRTGVLFTVMNTAGDAGLPDPTQVFRKYYRSPGAHRQIGSGLGLFLVEHWTRSLGGSATYQPLTSSQGVPMINFSIWIPQ